MTRLSTRDQARMAREEKAKALQGLFSNCFQPLLENVSGNEPSGNEPSGNERSGNEQFSKGNCCGKLKTLVAESELSFTAIGLLAILMEEFPLGRGHINFQKFADACNVAKSTVKTQIHILEQKGVIKLGSIQQTGRDLTIVFALQAEEKTTE